MGVFTVYAAFLVILRILAQTLGLSEIIYTSEDVNCWELGISAWYDKFQIITETIGLAVPIIPIIVN